MIGRSTEDCAEALGKELKTRWMAKKIFWRESTDSTLTWAKEEAKCCPGKELDGALFLAEEQTAGKGRLGRVWQSLPGENVYMTLLLMNPPVNPMNAASLTLVMGLSAARAAAELTGRGAGIKWPNDVVMSGRKICGILTEMQIKEQMPEFISIGIGINVNQRQFSRDLKDKATSLYLETGKEVSRTQAAARTIEYFEKYYELFLKTQDLRLLKLEYESLLLNKDEQVRVIEKTGERLGTARGITDQGELLVEDEQGCLRSVFSGEVSVRGLYSYV